MQCGRFPCVGGVTAHTAFVPLVLKGLFMTMDDGRLQPAWQPEAKEHFRAWLLQLLTPEGDGESNQPRKPR